MSLVSSMPTERRFLAASAAAGAFGICLFAAFVWGQAPSADGHRPTARAILGPSFTVPIAEQPAAKIVIDPPLANLLEHGVAVIQFRTENLRIVPVFGPTAVAVSPRVGHLHVRLDDAPWGWGHTSGEELIVADLPPGPHQIRIELADANHKPLAQEVVKFEVPRQPLAQPDTKAGAHHAAGNSPKPIPTEKKSGPVAGVPVKEQPPAKIIIDPLEPDLVAKGIALIRYRTENLQIAPVFGPATLAISPRVGHLHVTVDDAPWHWADASGGPVIVAGLPSGPHRILIELADANHKVLAHEVVKVEVPQAATAPAARAEPKAPAAAIEFSADGKLKQPVGYRKWVHVGTPLTPKELNDDEVSEFHAVYMDPVSFDHYEKTGELRDGTVMIKEFVDVGSKEGISGKGYFMGEFTGLEASVKDSKRFKDEPGNWAYFNFGTKYPLNAEASKETVESCNQCHQDSAKTDWVFSQYYPVLRGATPRSK